MFNCEKCGAVNQVGVCEFCGAPDPNAEKELFPGFNRQKELYLAQLGVDGYKQLSDYLVQYGRKVYAVCYDTELWKEGIPNFYLDENGEMDVFTAT